MQWSEAPWDSRVCGFPVLQITNFKLTGNAEPKDLRTFEQERDHVGAGMVSCRLPHDALRESMLLEDCGFRFIEMVCQPEHDLTGAEQAATNQQLNISEAHQDELEALCAIAQSAFTHERFRMDPRLDPAISDKRYRNWVASSLRHPTQKLWAIHVHDQPIAFFITELQDDGTCYWHLNAVAPAAQGQGFGKQAWQGMMQLARAAGAQRIRTCVAIRNERVMNLYAQLGFRFTPPQMTFHWVRP